MIRFLINIPLRDRCSCGVKGKKVDDRIFQCVKGCGCWDGAEEYIQRNVLIKERYTVVRDH